MYRKEIEEAAESLDWSRAFNIRGVAVDFAIEQVNKALEQARSWADNEGAARVAVIINNLKVNP